MGRVLKVVLLLVALLFVGLSMTGWWLLHFDEVEEPQLPGTIEHGVTEHGGLQRSWSVYLPKSRGAHPPLVIFLHGSMGKGEDMRLMSFYGFDAEAERGGYIAAYPDGYQGHWNDCRASADYAANKQDIDDVGFLRDMVAQLVERYGVDPKKVFAAGYSNGGQLAFRLGLEAPDLVRGIAAIAANLPVDSNLDCTKSGKPVSVLVINGTEDPVNPYDGGLVQILFDKSRGTVLSSEQTIAYWRTLAGYSGAKQIERWPDKAPDDGTKVTVDRFHLPRKPTVELITVVGGGHTMPNPTYNLPKLLGPTSHEFDTATVLWEFFKSLPEPRSANRVGKR